MPGFHTRPPPNKGVRYPADPTTRSGGVAPRGAEALAAHRRTAWTGTPGGGSSRQGTVVRRLYGYGLRPRHHHPRTLSEAGLHVPERGESRLSRLWSEGHLPSWRPQGGSIAPRLTGTVAARPGICERLSPGQAFIGRYDKSCRPRRHGA